MVVKERKMEQSTKICVDASDIYSPGKGLLQKELYKELAEVFRTAYRQGILITNDYMALCEIAIKEYPTISTKQYCDLVMTHDRVVMRLSNHVKEYEQWICQCFQKFYAKEKKS